MKCLNRIFLGLAIVAGFSAQAQDNERPWAVSFGVSAVDTRGSAGESIFDQPFLVKKNWNIFQSVSYLTVGRNIGSNFSVGASVHVNDISKYVNEVPVGSGQFVTSNPGDLKFHAVDLSLKYSFSGLLKSKVIDPSLMIGSGYTWFGDNSYITANGGLGITFWMSKLVGISLGSGYKYSFDDRDQYTYNPDNTVKSVSPLYPGYWQHSLGLSFRFGGNRDADKDGVNDKEDACPDVAGLVALKGCPDADGDGIADKDDACPNVKGLVEFKGCPDTDGDGVVDSEDDCPDVKGLVAFKGCPDTDGDGVIDSKDACPELAGLVILDGCPDADGDGLIDTKDKCPTVFGPLNNDGCPFVDTDKDGVKDEIDLCPTVVGSVSNQGCPEITKQQTATFNKFAKTIKFGLGKSSFYEQSIPVLKGMKNLLKENGAAKFSIEGHTDNTGSANFNMTLSEQRANEVKNYFIQNGIPAERMSTKGFGQTKPISSNKTEAGRANNRRVEVKLVK